MTTNTEAARLAEEAKHAARLASQTFYAHIAADHLGAMDAAIDALAALVPQAAEEVARDAARLDWLDREKWAYGFADVHEGNHWEIEGPFKNVREAIDAALSIPTTQIDISSERVDQGSQP